jgi:hypothetical protein
MLDDVKSWMEWSPKISAVTTQSPAQYTVLARVPNILAMAPKMTGSCSGPHNTVKDPTILARAQNDWHRPDYSVRGFTNLAEAPQYWQYPHNTGKDPHTSAKNIGTPA